MIRDLFNYKNMNLENKIKWAKRKDKNQSPLDFFRENYDSEMTRGQLRKKDSGLYQKLRKDGLLEEIPIKKILRQKIKN